MSAAGLQAGNQNGRERSDRLVLSPWTCLGQEFG